MQIDNFEKLELSYKELYNLYGNQKNEVPCLVDDEIFVQTPTGVSKIDYVVIKKNLPVIRLDIEDGTSIECSEEHLFMRKNVPVKSVDAVLIDTIFGPKKILEKTPLENDDLYDISIESPHWYIADPDTGVIHHNTFFVLGIMKQFLDDNEDGGVIYYDTEAAVTKEMMKERGIDTSRVIISEQSTVEGFRTHVSRTLDRYTESKERPPMIMVLDSLGMLSTNKETGDIVEGKDARDMTRAQLIRGTFRALSLKLARANVAMLLTNHVSEQIGAYVPTKVMGGGQGLRYAASQIVFLSKKKDRNGTEVVGNIIHCKMDKSRFTKENKQVDVRLSYDTGLDRYYGLLDLAEKYGIFKKTGTRYELPDGSKVFGKSIEENPQKYYTKEIMDQLEEAAAKEFKYGKGEQPNETSDESADSAEV